jgi:AcrR family transcriptional regulator
MSFEMPTIETKAPPKTRVERKREQARGRIVEAAEKLMRSRPVDEVTIKDITAAADVGQGTFYLHFKSKYDVLVPVLQAEAAKIDVHLQSVLRGEDDPAQVFSYSARYTGRRIVADELWRWFLQHSGIPVDDMQRTFGRFARRDFRGGIASGRFAVPDERVALATIFGGFVTALMLSFKSKTPETTIDQSVEIALRGLGLTAQEATAIAHRPLGTPGTIT